MSIMAAEKAGTTGRVGRGKRGTMAPLQVAVAKDYPKHHPKPQFAGAPPTRNVQQPRISTTAPPSRQSSFADPNGGVLHGAFHSPHLNSAGHVQHSPYAASHDSNYYPSHPSPHSAASASAHYPPTEGSDQMAATAHLHRPYPPIYHTPQSNSPASVASPQTHDHHGRSLYGQTAPQLAQPIYGYQQYSPMNQVHASPYAPHSGQQPHHSMTHGSMMQPPPSNAPMQPQQQPQQQPHPPPPPSMVQTGGIAGSSPRMRMNQMPHHGPHQSHHQPPPQTPPSHQQPHQVQQQTSSAQQTVGRMIRQHTPTQPPPISANLGQTPTPNINPSAAPGPIPATTPLVVRQDNNGVQWIAFEYSRDRVKSEYTIRCDVESVNVDSLSPDFMTENCVYPRACCGKDSYKGNRLKYETECNAVGWALAELNTCLRGKRGLIQRAVDSWRNSNQDPGLRSRRVRRQAKVHQRNKNAQQGTQISGPGAAGMLGTSSGSVASTGMRAPHPNPVNSMGAGQLHHHHARPDMAVPGQPDSSGEANYSSSSASRPPITQSHTHATPTELGPGRVFAGYPTYSPTASTTSPATLPGCTSLDGVLRPGGPTSGVIRDATTAPLHGPTDSRKRKFEAEDNGRQQDGRVRLGMHFSQDGSNVSPHAYRSYQEFPRSSYLPSVPAPATTTGPFRPATLLEGVPLTVENTGLQRRSLEVCHGPRTVRPRGEISELQATDLRDWRLQKPGQGLVGRADYSPLTAELRALPPSNENW